MSLMNLYIMLCFQFEFNLSDAEVKEEILAPYAIFCAMVKIWYLGVGVAFPYI